MAAYVIAEVQVNDAQQFEQYRDLVPPAIAAYGGRYLVRGMPLETLEGEWDNKRIVVVEFESAAKAREWWNSAEYSDAKRLRQQCAQSTIILVEGV